MATRVLACIFDRL